MRLKKSLKATIGLILAVIAVSAVFAAVWWSQQIPSEVYVTPSSEIMLFDDAALTIPTTDVIIASFQWDEIDVWHESQTIYFIWLSQPMTKYFKIAGSTVPASFAYEWYNNISGQFHGPDNPPDYIQVNLVNGTVIETKIRIKQTITHTPSDSTPYDFVFTWQVTD